MNGESKKKDVGNIINMINGAILSAVAMSLIFGMVALFVMQVGRYVK